MGKSVDTTKTTGEAQEEIQRVSFSEILEEYQRPIYNYLLRMTQNQTDAEDLTQETFIRIHSGLTSFRGDAKVSTWIYRIATNVSFDHFRRKSTRQSKDALSLDDIETDRVWIEDDIFSSPEQIADQSEMSACVQRFIRGLPPNYRAVLVLHDLQGLKNQEIADVLGTSLSNVKIRLHRARVRLRAALDTGCNFSHDERNVFVCEEKGDREEVRDEL
ncbi:MAG: sigma-70 family RNA polymerase sigma factor [Anaerolineales bacterium]|nr:sigma-70 family RNA polymerase sigma factor [Anaerolineales bacterium]